LGVIVLEGVTPGHHDNSLKFFLIGKDIWHLVFFFGGGDVLFKESPPSIMVTRNTNYSTEILWYGNG
jgi:hypothetical protein